MRQPLRHLLLIAGLLFGAVAVAAPAEYRDPPVRVARLSYIEGNVSFAPAGESQWLRAFINRPQVRGDRLWTDRRSRAELQLGNAAVRMDESTSVEILDLDDRIAQIELTQGTLNLRVRRLYPEQSYEIDTPTLALVIDRPGEFRIDVDPRGRWTEVVVWDGQATVYGDRARLALRDGEAIRFSDPSLRDYDEFRLPQPDDFDDFCQLRNERMDRSPSLRYLPDELIGYSDLDEYGTWSASGSYGNVWFPNRVDASWAPYRNGRWIWQDPWGWTWVDEAPWGFAPFHYGRWAYINRRWGWIPSPRQSRPVYAPALVAFVGNTDWRARDSGGRPIGWFPLGPRDVYVPSYRGSRDYFTRVNGNYGQRDARFDRAYENYSRGTSSSAQDQLDYINRRMPNAVTAVRGDAFASGQPVGNAALRIGRDDSAMNQVSSLAAMAPSARSVSGGAANATVQPPRDAMDRRVFARTAPPPDQASFESRREAMQRTPGVPANQGSAQQPQFSRGRDPGPTQNVQVVGGNGRMIARDPVQPNQTLPERDDFDAAGGRGRDNDADRQLERQRQLDDQQRAARGQPPLPEVEPRGRQNGNRDQQPGVQPSEPRPDRFNRQRENDAQAQRDAERQAEQTRQQQERSRQSDEQQRQVEAAQRERDEAQRQADEQRNRRSEDERQTRQRQSDFERNAQAEEEARNREFQRQANEQRQAESQREQDAERQRQFEQQRQRQEESQREQAAEQQQREAEREQQAQAQREQAAEQQQREAEREQQAQAQREQQADEQQQRQEEAQREQAERQAEQERQREEAESEREAKEEEKQRFSRDRDNENPQ